MKVLFSIYHWLLSFTGNLFYKNPSKDLFVVGVTGTKGKTTAVSLMVEIFKKAGKKVDFISSLSDFSNTMPGRWSIQRFLKQAVNKGCEYVFIEVTSQGVVQHRHKFIDWDAAVFLNLHPEHIESHGSYENYREAKLKFFRYLNKSKKSFKYFFVNKDDSEASYFIKETEKINNKELTLFSSDDVYKLAQGVKNKKSPDWLKADFNLVNLASAVAVAKSRAIKEEVIINAIENFEGVEGRLQFIQHKPFQVVVDYAHTPDSLRDFYKNLKPENSKLICVLGSAGGGRDKWKRFEMGKVAGNYCDKIILTSEDPYKEDPKRIITDIKKGLLETNMEEKNVLEIINRKDALGRAVSLAEEGDVVVTTGMGSQKYFYGPKGKVDWNEAKILESILEKK
ncbi:MAG: UDP-N-acetylmuramyl-tripeptide synthetase [Candidatus Paceibacterota bacterium]